MKDTTTTTKKGVFVEYANSCYLSRYKYKTMDIVDPHRKLDKIGILE